MSKETEAKIVEALDNAGEILERDALLEDDVDEFRGGRLPTQADVILQLAANYDLFHTPDGTAYADVNVEGHRETFRIDGKPFEKLLKHLFYRQTSEPATPDAVRKAIKIRSRQKHNTTHQRVMFSRARRRARWSSLRRSW